MLTLNLVITLTTLVAVGSLYIEYGEASSVNKDRYIMGSAPVNWADASRQCRVLSPNFELATIQNHNDAAEIVSFIDMSGDFSGEYWLGGRYVPTTACNNNPLQSQCWLWDRTPPAKPSNPPIIEFAQGVAIANPSSRLTIKLPQRFGEMSFTSSTDLMKFICDTRPSPSR